MQSLRVGILLSGARPVGQGINGALRGFAVVTDNEIPVIAKYLPDRELLCELLCAQLGRGLDLPIPEPLVLFDSSGKALFGSADVGYPNLLHYFESKSDKEVIIQKLKTWVHLQSASFFDELIFNADRHPGNLLYDGNDFHLIDHGLTLHSAYPPETSPDEWENKLFSLAISICENDAAKSKLSNNGSIWTDNLIERDGINLAMDSLTADKEMLDSLGNFLSVRQGMLKSMINSRINPAQTDFINA
jgi:hypothetical protein